MAAPNNVAVVAAAPKVIDVGVGKNDVTPEDASTVDVAVNVPVTVVLPVNPIKAFV